jgi:hypothetical protein
MKNLKILNVLLIFFISCSTAVFLSGNSLSQNSTELPENLNKSPGFFKGPKAPKFKGNKSLSAEKSIGKDKAVGEIPKKAKLVGAEFKSWKDFKDKELDNAIIDDVSEDRMIWEVQLSYPEGVEVGNDKYYDAIVTKVVDGETGEILHFMVESSPDKIVRGKREK